MRYTLLLFFIFLFTIASFCVAERGFLNNNTTGFLDNSRSVFAYNQNFLLWDDDDFKKLEWTTGEGILWTQ